MLTTGCTHCFRLDVVVNFGKNARQRIALHTLQLYISVVQLGTLVSYTVESYDAETRGKILFVLHVM